jgi:hypothetical protein
MHKRKVAVVEDPISPNLIPMIDIMFLLLLFFMLGADMAARETAEMDLADANKAKEIDPNADQTEPETIVNIHHAPDGGVPCGKHDNKGVCRDKDHWKWTISGVAYNKDTIKERLTMLAELSPRITSIRTRRRSCRGARSWSGRTGTRPTGTCRR